MNPLLVIGGTTASGKNDLAERIARKIPCRLISADSVQVYKRFNIGSSKPSPTALGRYNYHLIDFLEPHQIYSAGEFAKEAEQIIIRSWNEKKLPIVIGGTGFYIRALLQGLADFPQIKTEQRYFRNTEIDNGQIRRIYEILSSLDPKWAEKIGSNDKQRILRAWEVVLCTGYLMSTFKGSKEGILKRYKIALCYWILDFPKKEINPRIEKRTEIMLKSGLLEEVQALLENGIDLKYPAMKSVGYRQAVDYLGNKISREDLFLKIVIATRQYAKRQRTWFRKEKGLRLVSMEGVAVEAEKLFHEAGKWFC